MSGTDWSGTSVLPVSYYRIRGPSLNYQTKGGIFKTEKKKTQTKQPEKETKEVHNKRLKWGTSLLWYIQSIDAKTETIQKENVLLT